MSDLAFRLLPLRIGESYTIKTGIEPRYTVQCHSLNGPLKNISSFVAFICTVPYCTVHKQTKPQSNAEVMTTIKEY